MPLAHMAPPGAGVMALVAQAAPQHAAGGPREGAGPGVGVPDSA